MHHEPCVAVTGQCMQKVEHVYYRKVAHLEHQYYTDYTFIANYGTI